jgi:hypothetical protein
MARLREMQVETCFESQANPKRFDNSGEYALGDRLRVGSEYAGV